MKGGIGVLRRLGIAFTLLLFGVIFPFLMVLRIIPRSVTLSIFSYLSSVGGLFLGLYTLARYTQGGRE